ncbi:MAG: hypothetical protein CVU39_00725 [Chloroflexi bacterium HGW-Chloroflexi-10]|nr:MAG: hypothetical protein CVU39_00725 [Chloroflexi bacterium HGW-Chloroflexi-10]
MMLPGSDYRQAQSQQYHGAYQQILQDQLNATINYLHQMPREKIRKHLRSFITLLNEAQRYETLQDQIMTLITTLHPMPLRWGYGTQWESQLQFVLEHSSTAATQAQYQNDLADLQFYGGNIEAARQSAEKILVSKDPPISELARALRILFTSYRALGQPQTASQIFQKFSAIFEADRSAKNVPLKKATAWLRFKQNQLELLREQGKTSDALTLVEEMIWLDQQHSSQDALLTAELLTHRSTLLWATGIYQRAIDDLQHAIQLFQSEDDFFNAESLMSNLGLVYWSMGKLDQAEECLQRAIQFYRKSALYQLVTYDIGNLGLVYLARGDLDQALYWTKEHVAHCQKIGFMPEQHRGHRNLGVIAFYFQDYETVLQETNIAHTYFENHGSRTGFGLDILYTAMTKHHLGQSAIARQKMLEVLDLSKKIDSPILEQATLRCLAYISNTVESVPLLEKSLEMARQMDRSFDAAACLLALAACQSDESLWQQGVHILEGIGAGQWVEKHTIHNPPFLPFLI